MYDAPVKKHIYPAGIAGSDSGWMHNVCVIIGIIKWPVKIAEIAFHFSLGFL